MKKIQFIRQTLVLGVVLWLLIPMGLSGQVYKNAIGLYAGKDFGLMYKRFFNETTSMQVQYGEMTDNAEETASMHCSAFLQSNFFIGSKTDNYANGLYSIFGAGLNYDRYFRDFTDPYHSDNLSTSHPETYKKGNVVSFAWMLGMETPLATFYSARRFLKHLSIGVEYVHQIALHNVPKMDRSYHTMNAHIRYVFGGMSKK